MGKINLHANRFSQPARSVELFLKVNNIPYEFHPINVPKGDNRTESFLKINPTGTVPALVDDEFSLFESVAMIQYLAKKYSTPDHWYPKEIRARARINEYLAWHHFNTRTNGATGYFIALFIKPRYLKIEVSDEEVQEAKEKFEKMLDAFESYYLKGTEFISSNTMSIADIMALNELTQLVAIGIEPGKDRPKIADWYERCKQALQPHFDDVHTDIFSLRK
ncbi:Glutathione S-transferase theta-1 [Trichoplax sp. H2]|nr:Glutathione S-transferase theta-1 [Trichoplax sp. H2]|eukprot:RDD46532.1 Glutathione S-transferase theta-1 [Trichoplax sp. H2]